MWTNSTYNIHKEGRPRFYFCLFSKVLSWNVNVFVVLKNFSQLVCEALFRSRLRYGWALLSVESVVFVEDTWLPHTSSLPSFRSELFSNIQYCKSIYYRRTYNLILLNVGKSNFQILNASFLAPVQRHWKVFWWQMGNQCPQSQKSWLQRAKRAHPALAIFVVEIIRQEPDGYIERSQSSSLGLGNSSLHSSKHYVEAEWNNN